MKILIKAALIIFCGFLGMKESRIYGSNRNGCSASKGYELKNDKSEPIKFSSSGSAAGGSSRSSNSSSSKDSSRISASSSNSSGKNK